MTDHSERIMEPATAAGWLYRLPWFKIRLGGNRFERFDGHYWCGLICFYTNERLCRRVH